MSIECGVVTICPSGSNDYYLSLGPFRCRTVIKKINKHPERYVHRKGFMAIVLCTEYYFHDSGENRNDVFLVLQNQKEDNEFIGKR